MERVLLQRREKGNLAGYLMVISAFFQVIFMVVEKGRDLNWVELGEWATWFNQPGQILVWVLMLGAVLTYIGLNYTGIALSASKEPFRYTFWIGDFHCLNEDMEETLASEGLKNCKELLRFDLMQMLNDRIRRFSLLETAQEEKESAFSKRAFSHIHISGHYALKIGENEQHYLQIMAKVRIGPEGKPASLVAPIRFPLEDQGQLSPTGYQHLLERVFSAVASMIYVQIEEDINNKINLFPTHYLRAMALCHEAEDFARSNTIDGYERSIGLYQKSLLHYQEMGIHLPWHSRVVRGKWFTFFNSRPHLQAWSNAVLGFAKYRIFRNQMASLSGQSANPLYDLPELLDRVREVMEKVHMRASRIKEKSKRSFLKNAQGIADTKNKKNQLAPKKKQEATRKTLFETYVVCALAHRFLGAIDKSSEMLSWAAATMPTSLWQHPLYLMAKGLMEPDTHKSLVHFHHVVDLAPDFQMAQWFLAQELEKEFRRKDELDTNRASTVIQAYERVLHLNAGNIAAIGVIGHLNWLINPDGKLKSVEEKLISGTEIKSLNSETYIGDLNFRLARISAERGEFHLCRERYLEAAGIDPSVGSFMPPVASRSFQSDYDHINRAMIKRFEAYKDRVRKFANTKAEENGRVFSEKTRNFALAFALNDFGNACLRYFHFHGDEEFLLYAIQSYREAGALHPEMAVTWYNLQNALGWKGQWEEIGQCMEKARKFAPNWSLAAIQSADEWFKTEEGNIQAELDWAYGRYLELRRQNPNILTPEYDAQLDSWCSGLGDYQHAFDQKFLLPLRKIYAYSKNAALYEENIAYGPALINLLRKVQQIPWKKMDVEDVQVIVELLKVISYSNKPKLLSQAMALGDHLLKVIPQEHPLLSTQINLLSKCVFYRLFTGLVENHSQIREQLEDQKAFDLFLTTWIEVAIKDLSNQKFRLLEANMTFIPVLISHYNTQQFPLPKHVSVLWESIIEIYHETNLGSQLLEVDTFLIESLEVLHYLLLPLNHEGPTLGNYFEQFHSYRKQFEQLTNYWLQVDHGGFLSLYWYFFEKRRFEPKLLESIRERFFTLDRDKADNCFGNLLKGFYVISRQEQFLEQSIAYFTKVNQPEKKENKDPFNLHMASYYWHIHKRKWTKARKSILDAIAIKEHLNPILNGFLANVLLEIGLDYKNKNEIENTAFYLNQAVDYCGNDAELHFRLYETYRLKAKEDDSYLEKAAMSLSKAMSLDTKYDSAAFHRELQQLTLLKNADTWSSSQRFAPLVVEFDPVMEAFILEENSQNLKKEVTDGLWKSREDFNKFWGITYPSVLFRYSGSQHADPTGYFLVLNEIREGFYQVYPQQKFIFLENNSQLPHEEIKNMPLQPQSCGGKNILWIPEENEEAFFQKGFQLMNLFDHLRINLEHFLSQHLLEVFSFQDLAGKCRQFTKGACKVIADEPAMLHRFWECCRALLAENIPINNLEELSEIFLSHHSHADLSLIINKLRRSPSIQKHLMEVFLPQEGFLLSEELETALLNMTTTQSQVQALSLPLIEYEPVILPVRESLHGKDSPSIVVKEEGLRPLVKSLLLNEFPQVKVYSQADLPNDMLPQSIIKGSP